MDLSSPIHDPSFPSSKGLSSFYNWPEIWPFPNADGVHVYCPGVSDIGAASPKTELLERISGFPETIGNNQDASGGESTITEQSGSHGSGGRRRRRDAAAASEDDESSKLATTSGGNEMMNFKSKSLKVTGSGGEINNSKAEVEARSRNDNPSFEKSAPKQDFIHVRARRGQATDSHSLAERARREKISERMKILQHLVPGCNKVNGKASVLDEIINYIQSLQCQVEFLSMKLEAINTRMNSSMEGFSAKETYDAAAMIFGSHGAREFGLGSAPGWLHMQVGGGFERLA